MTERKWPTEDDLLAGRMPDGSRPPLHSKDLPEFDPLYLHSLRVKNEGVPELPPAIHGKDPADMTEEELHMLVDHRCLQQMDRALDFAMDMIDVGREGLALARSGKSDTAVPAVGGEATGAARQAGELTGDVQTGDNADSRRECSPSSRADETSAPRTGGTPVSRRMSAAQMIAVGERGSKLVFKIAPARAKLAHELVKRAKAADLKEEFYENRAVAVVKHTLCHLDDAFQDLGFGGWMPFRTVDQWLMFCGFMQRILAANGLIHSEHADVYRRLLDETPPPLPPGEQRTPQNWGQCFRNRTFHNMDYLKRNIAAKDAGRPPPHE